ncbi:RhoGEF domain-containing protein [Pholiota molesta]|nr:RhoGEF domain-containing protein [Pholiota molesta]
MALHPSPRKLVIPLATGDEPRPRTSSTTATLTKRVFYCGVVVEGSENGRRLPDEIQDLVLSLGNPIASESSTDLLSSSSSQSLNEIDRAAQRKRALLDPSALASVINELLTSERTYVKRLQILKNDYADPLRNFSRSKDTAIIPAYEAKTLFGNIDNLLPVNEAFLTDLEKMAAPNGKAVGGVGDVALRHFKELRGFEQYKQYYVKREDAQAIFEKEASKRSSRFTQYVDRIKYQSTDARNRVGLRELLMEPQNAQAETDEQTKRAAIFYCLIATIDGFPPDLFSNSRKYIDCIDVEDILTDTSMSAASAGNGATSLHCTLFLFDDKLVIVKRPNSEKGGKALSGLDGVDKVTKAGGIPTGKKKSGMTCKGVVDITEVVATDVGGAEINLFLENPPQDQTDRWSGRPFRSLSVVNPPSPINLDPVQTESDKQRFLENLWKAQATYRARAGQSVVLCSDEQEVECRSGRTTLARTYYNVYQRTAFLQEVKKSKVVVHIERDRYSTADPIPFGIGGPPFVVIRVQLLDGGLCRYSVGSSDPNDEGEEDIVQTPRVPSRVIQTIHQFGLFEFKTGRNSLPSTPTARSKVAIFGLDAISRNLFNGRPGSVGDFFAGSINGNRRNRSRSTASRSSMYTQTTTTADSMKFSHRSNSTATAATTMSSMDDESFFASRSSKGKMSSTRTKSRSPISSDREHSPGRRSGTFSRPHSRSSSRGMDTEYSDNEDDNGTILAKGGEMPTSDQQLAMQLELARQNSLIQDGKRVVPMQIESPNEATIYEEGSPYYVRPSSRASGKLSTHQSINSTSSSVDSSQSPTQTNRPLSIHSVDRRPLGPRSPSPLPPSSPRTQSYHDLPSMDDDLAQSTSSHQHLASSSSSHYPPQTPGIKRSNRQPLFPAVNNTDSTPKSTISSAIPIATPIEPLSIKKKTSLRNSTLPTNSLTPVKKTYARHSPLSRTLHRVVSPRRVSPQVRKHKPGSSVSSTHKDDNFEQLEQLAVSTKEDIETSRRALKRIRLQTDTLRLAPMALNDDQHSHSRPSSPDKATRTTPQPNPPPVPLTKAAQERLEEMRNLIGRRQGEGTPRTRPRSGTLDNPRQPALPETNNFIRIVDNLINEVDQDLSNAQDSTEALQTELAKLASQFRDRAAELERMRLELQNSKRQCELVKSLLADATAEKEIMYEAFNEELDGIMGALSMDLRQTKETKNNLSRENSHLKRKLAEVELEKEEWGDLLRSNGLIP